MKVETVENTRLSNLLYREEEVTEFGHEALPEDYIPSVKSEELISIFKELLVARSILQTPQVSIQWLNAEPNPRTPATGFDAGRSAWKFHAVLADPRQNFQEISRSHSLCGLQPTYGWGLDLFMDINDSVAGKCSKCERARLKLGLADSLCKTS